MNRPGPRVGARSGSRKVVRLTVDHLAELPAPCTRCLFWELDPVRRQRIDPAQAAAEKQAWVSELLRDWGSCGRVVLVDGAPAGFVVYAPEAFVPGAAGFPTAPISPDAVLLTMLYVAPGHAGGGLARMLVQGMARDLVGRGGFAAVEAFGATDAGRAVGRAGGGSCVVPAGVLTGVGFRTVRPHPLTPRLRMDLRTTVTWRGEVEAALERLLGAVRPAPKSARPPTAAPMRGARDGGRREVPGRTQVSGPAVGPS